MDSFIRFSFISRVPVPVRPVLSLTPPASSSGEETLLLIGRNLEQDHAHVRVAFVLCSLCAAGMDPSTKARLVLILRSLQLLQAAQDVAPAARSLPTQLLRSGAPLRLITAECFAVFSRDLSAFHHLHGLQRFGAFLFFL